MSENDAVLILKQREYQRRWRVKKQMNTARNKIILAVKGNETKELHSLIAAYSELLLMLEASPSHC